MTLSFVKFVSNYIIIYKYLTYFSSKIFHSVIRGCLYRHFERTKNVNNKKKHSATPRQTLLTRFKHIRHMASLLAKNCSLLNCIQCRLRNFKYLNVSYYKYNATRFQ